MKTIDPAGSSQPICGIREAAKPSSTYLNSQVDNVCPYEIDAEVLEHLPIMYQKIAGVFVDSGRLVITNGLDRAGMVRVEDSYVE